METRNYSEEPWIRLVKGFRLVGEMKREVKRPHFSLQKLCRLQWELNQRSAIVVGEAVVGLLSFFSQVGCASISASQVGHLRSSSRENNDFWVSLTLRTCSKWAQNHSTICHPWSRLQSCQYFGVWMTSLMTALYKFNYSASQEENCLSSSFLVRKAC